MNGFGCKSTHTAHSKVCHSYRRSWSLEQHFSTISVRFTTGSSHHWRIAKCHFLSHIDSEVKTETFKSSRISIKLFINFSFFELKATTKRVLYLWLTCEDANTKRSNQFWRSYKICKFVLFFSGLIVPAVSYWMSLRTFEGNLQLPNLSCVHYKTGHVLAKAKDLVRQLQIYIRGLFIHFVYDSVKQRVSLISFSNRSFQSSNCTSSLTKVNWLPTWMGLCTTATSNLLIFES